MCGAGRGPRPRPAPRPIFSIVNNDSASFPPSRHPGWTLLVAGWGAFLVLWTLFLLGWGQGETPLQAALISGVITTGTAALLAVPVWRGTARWAWPDTLRFGFFVTHLVAAVVFAAAWTASVPVIAVLMEGGRLSDVQLDAQTIIWRLFMGVWLYFIVAGVSYAVRISQHLQHQRELAARAESMAAQAHLQAMRSQLRPHFLFNALHSVSSLIETDADAASDAMERLGDLLRYTIRERDEDRVRLEEEWAFVEDYLALQSLRFGDRVQVQVDMDDACGSMPVPPFVVQPLVENAFVHGPGARPEGGKVLIRIQCNANTLEIDVSDDGPGPDPEGRGTGLDNLRRRLEVLYGPEATVELQSLEPQGALTRVRIPRSTA